MEDGRQSFDGVAEHSAIIPGIIRHFREIVKKKKRQAPSSLWQLLQSPPYIYLSGACELSSPGGGGGRKEEEGRGGPAALRQSVNSRARLPLKTKEEK
jgi:hypothetical protein